MHQYDDPDVYNFSFFFTVLQCKFNRYTMPCDHCVWTNEDFLSAVC